MTADILFTTQGKLGLVTLNRPQTLNALNLDMIRQFYRQLTVWEMEPNIHAVLVKSNSERAFCAGGDVRAIYQAKQKGEKDLDVYFAEEYLLDQKIKNYPKPYIALMDGITMGGGAGISVNGSVRIATEKLQFAMPETAIGFFPDVGSSYFLSRCPGKTGYYLGLTGARLNVSDTFYVQLIDYVINSADCANCINALATADIINQSTIQRVLSNYAQQSRPAALANYREIIDNCFAAASVEEILQRLDRQQNDWAINCKNILLSKSPISLKVTLKALQKGATLDFVGCQRMEYQLATHFLSTHDFFEGVRAVLVDKDQQPRWQPVTLAEISEEMVARFFA